MIGKRMVLLSPHELEQVSSSQLPPGPRMPAIFVGHGSPTNALEDNPFTRAISQMGRDFKEPPRAILVISAHWLTSGIMVQAGERPETIHDFAGFPEELYRVQYPAPGAPSYARATAQLLGVARFSKPWSGASIMERGQYSATSFPEARIPVFQLSIDWAQARSISISILPAPFGRCAIGAC